MIKNSFFISFTILILLTFAGCGKSEPEVNYVSPANAGTIIVKEHIGSHKVTFIEIGSVNCIPCKMMQPVMKKIEDTYGSKVKIVFYDVWTPEGRPYGAEYNIRAIPTQVYLDAEGKEFYRHVGFAPFEDVKEILASKGVK